MKRDMRTKANKAIARELTLHGDITLLRLKLADRERRIRAARKRAWEWGVSKEFWDILDLRRPLPRGTRK